MVSFLDTKAERSLSHVVAKYLWLTKQPFLASQLLLSH